MSKVIVVGGGAAGMMAAIAAGERGHQVTLLERNEKLGKKLFITGKGRCNLTNAAPIDQLFSQIVTNPKFLYSAIYGFDNFACMAFFEEKGLKLKTERGNRVFPLSDHSSDVIRILEKEIARLHIRVKFHTRVSELLFEEDANGAKVIKGVKDEKGNSYHAHSVILATGGVSYPSTGSAGDGIKLAEKAGHAVNTTYPGLVPLKAKENWCKSLMGLSLKNVRISLLDGKKTLYEGFGEMLFTHFGVSGPLILSASSYVNQILTQKALQLYIDLKPALSMEQLDDRLIREFEEKRSKQFKNALQGLFPSALIPVMVSLSSIDPEKKAGSIGKEERHRFAGLIKGLPLTITGTGSFEEAIITKGGIHVKEINPSTMESKRIANLYFAGEMIDVDALTGGFNLQIAWSTGHLAGESVS
ncbi:MAG: NAD(P)/FAD-dependent oxidoreductase [Lachnospiraceae bacterium]|nr:NAD(P)/FAD-dependent oxidoreductase [Lachnospiraceae bacterium]